ncbi:hypothetical protein PAHAL_1G170700 [Panicum hallii]|uniref:Transcription factor TFIIIB component B'' Myb domain-containing protein n=1 Tax=Panicum hallii TaxID=206008 RepID=A0A2T8KVH6_9POAL|nr:hypothetical protein PAHAL_1G170700 [Panicum hallii]PVH66176.1 hypothetical protein PAHAL_1G170700 [Panicum hallii]PVH66179.1 hypothetical protein PAHAL_1G170700 [Panicum hallii]
MTARCQPPNGRGSARSSPPPLTHVGHLQQRAGHLLPSAAHLSRQTTPLLPPQTPAMLDLACCQGYPGQVAAAHRQAQAAAPPFSQPLGHASMPCPWIIAEATCKSQPNVGREKGKGKSVSFGLSDASGVVTPTDTNSEMGNFSNSCNDKLTDENLRNLSQQTVEKEHNDNESWYHEGEPLDHAVEQLPKSGIGENRSSMKLRSRKKSQKVGTPKHTDDYFDEDCVEPSLVEEDNDSGDDYTAGTNRKVRKKSRDDVEEPQQQNVQKDKSQVSSRGRKRTLKDASAEKPEKKLTHRIRQRRAKEVKTLLEKPHEINPMKLSAAHLRLLQEARECVNAKENPSGPSSNTSFQFHDMDDLDYGDEEARNFDNDRTQNHVQDTKKLNYHSYMNKQTRGKWSKSDTDVFYQGLRQFGSDFAMIQQLLPDKTRQQIICISKR